MSWGFQKSKSYHRSFPKRSRTQHSKFVLGPRQNATHLIEHGELLVSAYPNGGGELRYSGPVMNKERKASPSVLYRIRIKLKKELAA